MKKQISAFLFAAVPTRSLPLARTLAIGLLAFAAAAHAEAAPANDNYANRQSIPSQISVSVTGTTVGATQESFEVTNAGSSQPGESINETKTVWYDYVAPVDGLLNIDITRTTSQGLTYALVFQGATPDLAHLIDQGYLPGYADGTDYSAPGIIHVVAGHEYTISLGNTNYPGTFTLALNLTPDPAFFAGEKFVSDGVYYLSFSNGNLFGYYTYLSTAHFIYHYDLGFEYVFDTNDGTGGVYLYDFASKTFFYTSPSFSFPYLYDFTLKAFLYYYPDQNNAGHYTTNPRYFYNFGTGQIISK